jgi:hypothetical protein
MGIPGSITHIDRECSQLESGSRLLRVLAFVRFRRQRRLRSCFGLAWLVRFGPGARLTVLTDSCDDVSVEPLTFFYFWPFVLGPL